MRLDLCHSKLIKEKNEALLVITSLSPAIKMQIIFFLFLYICYRSRGENLFKNQQNLT